MTDVKTRNAQNHPRDKCVVHLTYRAFERLVGYYRRTKSAELLKTAFDHCSRRFRVNVQHKTATIHIRMLYGFMCYFLKTIFANSRCSDVVKHEATEKKNTRKMY